MVGFGVQEDFVTVETQRFILTEDEYRSAAQVMAELELARRTGIDAVESELFRSLGWFRKTADGTDFLDYNRDTLRRVNQFALPESIPPGFTHSSCPE